MRKLGVIIIIIMIIIIIISSSSRNRSRSRSRSRSRGRGRGRGRSRSRSSSSNAVFLVWCCFAFYLCLFACYFYLSVGPKHGTLFQKQSCRSSDGILC